MIDVQILIGSADGERIMFDFRTSGLDRCTDAWNSAPRTHTGGSSGVHPFNSVNKGFHEGEQ